MRRITLSLLGGCLLLLGGIVEIEGAGIVPVALTVLNSGEILILDSQQGVFWYRSESRKATLAFNGFGIYDGVDFSSGKIGVGEFVFVSKVARSQSIGARVVQYDLLGNRKGEWVLSPWKGRCSGVAVDPSTLTGYVASPGSSEVLSFDLRKPGSALVPLGKIPKSIALGPMILDGKRRRLLVADDGLGKIITLALDTGRSDILATEVGEPLALAIDVKSDELFIADSLHKQVLSMSLAQGNNGKVGVFAKLKEFREPSGLAIASDGGVWVGDSWARALFLFSRDGKLVNTIHL